MLALEKAVPLSLPWDVVLAVAPTSSERLLGVQASFLLQQRSVSQTEDFKTVGLLNNGVF